MLSTNILAIATTVLSFGTTVFSLGAPFRIVVQDQLHLPNNVKWYLASNARRVLGTANAGVYAFGTNTPSGEIWTNGARVGAVISSNLYPLFTTLTGSGTTTTFSVSSTGELIWKSPNFTQAVGQTAQFIQIPVNDFQWHEIHAYLGPNNYGDAKLFVEWV